MKKSLALTLFFIFITAGAIYAEGPDGITFKRHTFEVSPELSYRIYNEPNVAKEEGWMAGVNFSYTYHNRFMVKGEFIGLGGSVDYSNSGKIDDIPDFMLEFRGLGGYDFPIKRSLVLTPFAGIGYRFLDDDASGRISSNGRVGYDRQSNYIYSPIGLNALWHLGSGWFVAGTGEFDIFWWGKQYSYLTDVHGYLDDAHNEQHNGWGARGQITIEKIVGSRIVLGAGPFVRYWDIGESDHTTVTHVIGGVRVTETVFEPKNHTTEIGAKFIIKF